MIINDNKKNKNKRICKPLTFLWVRIFKWVGGVKIKKNLRKKEMIAYIIQKEREV